ncbi:hypothetical protein [Haliangium sp.]|uniref:hypothetical protein n=1 Tax=Haliangium sp. TaxID=2663208 RepID=UPI003D0D6B88
MLTTVAVPVPTARRGRASCSAPRRRARSCWPGLLLMALALGAGCGDNFDANPPTPPDARLAPLGPDAAAVAVDAAPMADAAPGCQVFTPAVCSTDTPCTGADQACVAGACVATCGQDVSGFEAALGAGLAVLANVCVSPALQAAHAGESDGCEALSVYDLGNEVNGDGDLVFTLRRFSLVPGVAAPTPAAVGTHVVDLGAGITAFAGSYLVLPPGPGGGGAALFGYTESGAGFPGEVIRMDTSDGSSAALTADGNFDVDWIDDDRYLINGAAADDVAAGQGLYLVDLSGATPAVAHVVTGLGDFSGGVAVDHERGLVFAGGYFLASGDKVYALPLADIEAAAGATPIDADATAAVQRFAIPSSFTRVGDRLVSFDFASMEHQVRALSVAGDGTISVDDPVRLAAQPFSGVTPVGADRALLHHGAGSLLVAFVP